MMAAPRFNYGDHGDRRILDRATELKITLFRSDDGDVSGGFELHGNLGSDSEEFFGGAAQDEDLRFLAELLQSFQRVKE